MTAFTPSAVRKPGLGISPLAVLAVMPPVPWSKVKMELWLDDGVVVMPPKAGAEGVPGVVIVVLPDKAPLPNVTFWALKVEDQSTPFLEVGLLEISISLVSISTCLVC